MGSARWLCTGGILLVLLGAVLYLAGFGYGLRFAGRPEEEPAWLDVVFPTALIIGGLGLVLVVAGFVQWFRRGR
jgi:hypothetical protein